MAIWSPLTTNWAVNTIDSQPRTAAIDSIIHHHTAGTNKLATLALFAPGGREVTPNYFIAGNEIWGIVPEDRRAFTSGSPYDDQRAITYEILNSSGAPGWNFSPETLDTVARLDADIASRYGIPLQHSQPGFLEHRNLFEWFGRSYPTACAGPAFNINQIIQATAANMNTNNNPAQPEEEDDEMSRPICIAKQTTGQNVEVTIFNFDTGEEHTFSSTINTAGQSYNRNVALTYGCSPQVPISYVSASHYDKIKSENAATRKRVAS